MGNSIKTEITLTSDDKSVTLHSCDCINYYSSHRFVIVDKLIIKTKFVKKCRLCPWKRNVINWQFTTNIDLVNLDLLKLIEIETEEVNCEVIFKRYTLKYKLKELLA